MKISSIDNFAELTGLERDFSQSTTKYISRRVVRLAIRHLYMIKKRDMIKQRATVEIDWNQEQWFHHLVDSDTVVQPLRHLMDSLEVCRHNVASSLYTIVLFGKLEEKQFFDRILATDVLSEMKLSTAQKVFKYFGGVMIEGSSDCSYLMAGNDMKSVDEKSADGTIGGFLHEG